jgi:2-methylisocitrate lyase-like PEP mutase family enzyme
MNDDKANRFEQLHRDGNCFIMANAWNAGSFGFASEQIPDAELCKLFSKQ